MSLSQVIDFLKQTDELSVAKTLLSTFSKYSNSLQQYDELGMLFEKVKAYPESLKMLEKCLAIASSDSELHSIRANLAKVYNHTNNPKKSLFYSGLNLRMNENDYEAKMEQSFSYYLNGDFQKSYEVQNDLLKDPNISESVKKRITFNMGTFELARGNFKLGLQNMIMGGKEIGIWPTVNRPFLKWNGANTSAHLLVFAEAGIGDEFVNVRFMHELSRRNIKATWVESKPDLLAFFKSNKISVCHPSELKQDQEYICCDSMMLPVLLDLDKSEIWNRPYLKPKYEYIQKWKAILPKKYITVRWSGNPYYDHDLHRTIDKELLFSKLAKYNLPLVSLQIDSEASDNLICPEIKSWDDTIAIQYLATMNITSCTSTAHSAGASGANCIVLPPIATYYPWVGLRDDSSSFWYGSNLKVFPQTVHKNWEITISRAMEYLDQKLERLS